MFVLGCGARGALGNSLAEAAERKPGRSRNSGLQVARHLYLEAPEAAGRLHGEGQRSTLCFECLPVVRDARLRKAVPGREGEALRADEVDGEIQLVEQRIDLVHPRGAWNSIRNRSTGMRVSADSNMAARLCDEPGAWE